MVREKELPTMVGLSLGLVFGGKPKIVSASFGGRALADELSPFKGVRTPPFPALEASCPGGLPPSSGMTLRPHNRRTDCLIHAEYPKYIVAGAKNLFHRGP